MNAVRGADDKDDRGDHDGNDVHLPADHGEQAQRPGETDEDRHKGDQDQIIVPEDDVHGPENEEDGQREEDDQVIGDLGSHAGREDGDR